MFYRINSLYLTQDTLDHSNDCITQYNHFYGLVEKLYPNKPNMQKINLALQMIRICKNKKLMDLYLAEYEADKVHIKKKKKTICMRIKKIFSFK
ncbi:uncharacterized protein METZ01_LOCUS125232 [marine metagenome]|uniref:Uncharacterized protein n=1 Tax=marine metagenome TaxID=408172 RepID=A0A381Y5S8_9ZZZZ|tara:strand:- start:7405 stop:7686 length:282 start_codon:yes stop_codon:yes gene_type:complete